jgi:hypothetical protein
MTTNLAKIAEYLEEARRQELSRPELAQQYRELAEAYMTSLTPPRIPLGIDLRLNDPETDFALGLNAGDKRLLCAVLSSKGEPN